MVAASLAAPIFLGERSGAEEPIEAEPLQPATWAERGATRPGLTTLAAEIECGRLRVVAEEVLGERLRTRLALKTLRRRAEKRGHSPVLRCTSPDLRAVAKSAGWQTELVSGPAPSAGP